MPVFREDPYPAFNFLVELSFLDASRDAVVAGFSEVSGLDIEQEFIEYRNGNDRNPYPRQLPGLVRFAPLVLKRGVTGDTGLWEWMALAQQGRAERASGVITLLDEQRQAVMAWKIRDALPRRLSGPRLNANRSEVAIETLELVCSGLEIDD